MKYFLILLGMLLITAGAIADIGPSPSFSFSISNADDYSGYTFYYAGNIWPDKLDIVSGTASVYKLNTSIKFYAVPDEIAQGQETIQPIPEEAFASDVHDLQPGRTVIEITSMDEEAKHLSISITGSTIDDSEDISKLINNMLIIVVPLAVLAIIFIGLIYLIKKKK